MAGKNTAVFGHKRQGADRRSVECPKMIGINP
jgi:hypothetical protein